MIVIESVGRCAICSHEICCLDGFLNGIINDQNVLICFTCQEKIERSLTKDKNEAEF